MLTVITPIGPRHDVKFHRCAESVQAQTIPVVHLYDYDAHGHGPAPIRNALLAKVETPYVTFLDADDWLEPDFAETMLAAMRPGRYAYCDWYEDGKHVAAPEKAWCNGTWHVITAVLHSPLAQSIRFDETLPGMEDTDFFIRVIRTGTCGIAVRKPLMHYTLGGGRAETIHLSGEVMALKEMMHNRYGGTPMSCCGADLTQNFAPIGQKQEGDVLAQAMWKGNREEYGRATGRRYGRLSWPKQSWVDPRDVQAAPHLWQIIPQLNQEGGVAEQQAERPLAG